MIDRPASELRGLVSCVVIFLDAERFLAEAVESVLAQSYGHWELILVDDGSTDGSAEIAQTYAQERPEQIRLLRHPGGVNRGKSASRNLGLSAARGEFLAMLDADDVWISEKLEQQVSLLESNADVGMVYGPVLYWYGWTGRPLDRLMDAASQTGLRPSEKLRIFEPPTLLGEMILADARRWEAVCPYPSSIMLRRSLFEACGGFDEDFVRLYDDAVFLGKAFLKGRVLVTDQVWARYRLHPDEPHSHSYQRALENGEWHPTKANSSERDFLVRIHEHVRRASPPWALPWLRLRAILWWARARYGSPGLFRTLERVDAIRTALKRRFRQGFRLVPDGARWIRTGDVRWGDFDRLTPMDDRGGFWRGAAIRREYAGRFLARQRHLIRGRVAEVGDDTFACTHGSRQSTSVERLPATMFDHDTQGRFDCIIAVDVLQFCGSPEAFVTSLHDRLEPGGAALVAVPGLLPLFDAAEDRWRFTPTAARALFGTAFSPAGVHVESFGNVQTAAAALYNLGTADLNQIALDVNDPLYPVMVMIVARRLD